MRLGSIFLNLLLLLGVIFLAEKLKSDWDDFQIINNLKRLMEEETKSANLISPLKETLVKQSKDQSDFAIIWERDLFKEGRRPEDVKIADAKRPPAWILLHGVTEIAGKKQVIVTVYKDKTKKKGQLETLEVGDEVQGYSVVKIGKTTVWLRWKEQKELIQIKTDLSLKPSRSTIGENTPPKVTIVGSAPRAVGVVKAKSKKRDR